MRKKSTTDYGLLMLGVAIASAPMIMIFIAFQRCFTQGITMVAVKRDRSPIALESGTGLSGM